MKLWTDSNYPIIISCAKNLVPWTIREVENMGYKVIDKTENIVVVRGAMRDVLRLNLYLRTAHRVLVPLLRGPCRHIRDLYDKVVSIDWENIIPADGYFSVSSIVHNDTVRDTRLPALVTKDAIADRIRNKVGRRPDSGPDYDLGAAVFVHWEDRQVIIYIDTSGAPLSKRGYRKIPGSAPLQETLAAACIDALKWDRRTPFISPMCGSGTPAIEAALAAIGRAPGSLRSRFSFMSIIGWNQIIPGEKAPRTAPRQRFGATPEQIWKDMLLEAAENEKTTDIPAIYATDISPEAIQNAQLNAHAARVDEFITFKACDFSETPIPPLACPTADSSHTSPNGVVFFNPEYGIRLGDPEELKVLYARMGTFMKEKCAGMTGGLITGNPMLAKCVEINPVARIPFFNGPIDCRLLVFAGCRDA